MRLKKKIKSLRDWYRAISLNRKIFSLAVIYKKRKTSIYETRMRTREKKILKIYLIRRERTNFFIYFFFF